MNFEDLESNEKPQEISEEDKRFMHLCYSIFETTEDGKELMGFLKERLLRPVAPHNMPQSYANFREGENNLVRTFMYSCASYKKISQSN